MEWHTGLRRLRLVGTIALAIGVVLGASVLITNSLGYAPDTAVAPLFAALWPVGLVLAILGGLLWVTAWVLQGFVAPTPVPPAIPPEPRRAHPEE